MSSIKLKAIIVDDEPHCRMALKKQLEWYCPEVDVVDLCNNAQSARVSIKDLKPDLVFLDIEMPHENGLDLIRSYDELSFEVIFTTAYDQYALDAFKVHAVDYLLKPINDDDLVEAVSRVAMYVKNKQIAENVSDHMVNEPSTDDKKVRIPTSEGIEFVAVSDVIHCVAEGSYSRIIRKVGEDLFIAKTLKYLEETFDHPHMIRVHQSHLINSQYIVRFKKQDGGQLILDDTISIPLSRSKKAQWLEWIKG